MNEEQPSPPAAAAPGPGSADVPIRLVGPGEDTRAPASTSASAPAAAPPAPPAAPAAPVAPNPYDLAEEGWRDLIAASDKIQSAANRIKKTARSMDGYEVEKALIKHKPDLMKKHLDGLRLHRKEYKL